jgi:hypothetical protein
MFKMKRTGNQAGSKLRCVNNFYNFKITQLYTQPCQLHPA